MQDPILIPELDVSNLEQSLKFYTSVLGFTVMYERAEERFVMLEREGAQIMIEEAAGPGRRFTTADLHKPFGRGVNFQIKVSNINKLHDDVEKADHDFLIPLEEKWYKTLDAITGNKQFVIEDPDGYLLRFFEDLGTKPA
ncbi:MAG TPA: VOC family protein [Acidimicrobiia bacterium]|nr:VOC family protein [Acidimicrobiia bacterium]